MDNTRKIIIDQNRCKGCRLCIIFCPKKSFTVSKDLNKLGIFPIAFTDGDNCNSCGFCYIVCPEVCIEVYK